MMPAWTGGNLMSSTNASCQRLIRTFGDEVPSRMDVKLFPEGHWEVFKPRPKHKPTPACGRPAILKTW